MPFLSARWIHYGLEVTLAVTAAICAIGWQQCENKSHLSEVVDKLIVMCDGMPKHELQVYCKDVTKDDGDWRVQHWIVRRESRLPDD